MAMEVTAEERRKLRLNAMKKRRAAAATTSDDAAAAALKKLKTVAAADVSAAVSATVVLDTRPSHSLKEKDAAAIPKRKVDTQVRYDPPPNTHMSEDELKEWRKEQRRIRNRDSAAASRARTKDRISELEAQNEQLEDAMDGLHSKHRMECVAYEAKIQQLEAQLREYRSQSRGVAGQPHQSTPQQPTAGQELSSESQAVITRPESHNAVVSASSASESEESPVVDRNHISPPSSPVLSAMTMAAPLPQGQDTKGTQAAQPPQTAESAQVLTQQVEQTHQVQPTQPPHPQQEQESLSTASTLPSSLLSSQQSQHTPQQQQQQHARQHITEMISRTACV